MTFGENWGWGSPKEESRKIYNAFRDAGGNFMVSNVPSGTYHLRASVPVRMEAGGRGGVSGGMSGSTRNGPGGNPHLPSV